MLRSANHPSSQTSLAYLMDEIVYVDSIDIAYPAEEGYSLFGSTGIHPSDSNQGGIGNCWIMHGAAAVAERPGRLEKVFLNKQLSNNGIYGF